nr:hypothetical protein CFP56_06726 [Quercus suber]
MFILSFKNKTFMMRNARNPGVLYVSNLVQCKIYLSVRNRRLGSCFAVGVAGFVGVLRLGSGEEIGAWVRASPSVLLRLGSSGSGMLRLGCWVLRLGSGMLVGVAMFFAWVRRRLECFAWDAGFGVAGFFAWKLWVFGSSAPGMLRRCCWVLRLEWFAWR